MNNTALSPSSFLLPPSPMFSVIIPVYNVAPYLRACLDSVLAAVKEVEAARAEGEKVGGQWNGKQPVVEIICVDDGSTDGSGEILDEYREKVESSSCEFESRAREGNDEESAVHLHLFSPPHNPPPHPPSPSRPPLFRVLHQKNAGVSAARNAALDAAAGEWVTFVDADDLVSPWMFCACARIIQECPRTDIVRFDTKTFKDGECVEWNDASSRERETDVSKDIPYIEVSAALWGAVYRRTIFPSHGFKPYCRGEDLLFVGECALAARSVVRSTMSAYAYRRRSGSAMCSRMNVKKLVDRLGYSHDWLIALSGTPKVVPRAIFHKIGVNITEGFIFDLYWLEDKTSREEMWRLWYANLGWMRELEKFPAWTKFVIVACDSLRLRLVALILCWMPQRLKKMGLHR